MKRRRNLQLSLLLLACACGEDKKTPVGPSGPATGPTVSSVARDLDPLKAVFDQCSLAECRAVGAALVKGLADKRYSGKQVRERLAFLGTAEIARIRELAPGFVPVRVPESAAGATVDREIARIRALGFASDAASLAELEKLGRDKATRHRHELVALGALARRGDKDALRRLRQTEEVESLAVWLDVTGEKGVAKIVAMFLDSDPMRFERALQLVEQMEELAFEGVVDLGGLEIGAALHPKVVNSRLDLSRLTAILTSVPGCRTAALARKILDHADFPQLLRLVEGRGRLMDILALIEIVDDIALRLHMRDATEQSDRDTQGFWLARRLELGDEEVVHRWMERLEVDSAPAFFPGLVVLAETRAPDLEGFFVQRLQALQRAEPMGRQSMEIYRALAVYAGLPRELGFPSREDLSVLGKESAAPILEKLEMGRGEEALLAFLQAWDFKKRPAMELLALGRIAHSGVQSKLRELAADPSLGLRHVLLGALAVGGDKQAREEFMGFLEAGIRGFRERLSPLSLTLDADIKTLPTFLAEVRNQAVLPEKLIVEILPLFGLYIDERCLPARRLIRYELSGGKFYNSRIAGGLVLGPER